MTADEWSDWVARNLYSGTVPDIWKMLGHVTMVTALKGYAEQEVEKALKEKGL